MHGGRITCIVALGLALAGAATVRGQEAEPSGARTAPVAAPAPKAAPKPAPAAPKTPAAPPASPGPAAASPEAKPAASEPAAPATGDKPPAGEKAAPAAAPARTPTPRRPRPRRRTTHSVEKPAPQAAKPAVKPAAKTVEVPAKPAVKPPAAATERPFLTDYEDPKAERQDMPLGRVILDLAWKLMVVLGVAYAALYALRGLMVRQGGLPGRKGALRVLESTTLAPNRSIHLVRVAGKVIVVGSTPEQVTALAEIDDPEELARIAAESAPTFAARLDGALGDNGHASAPSTEPGAQAPADVATGVRDSVRHLWDQVQQIRGLRPPKGGPR